VSSSLLISWHLSHSKTPLFPLPIDTMAETLASSQPDRITSVSVFTPIRNPSEPTIMDLPAPVSPVSTLKPGRKEREMESTRAKFLIVSSSSTRTSFGGPCQFFRKRFIIRRVPGGDQKRVMRRMSYGDQIAGFQIESLLPVTSQQHPASLLLADRYLQCLL